MSQKDPMVKQIKDTPTINDDVFVRECVDFITYMLKKTIKIKRFAYKELKPIWITNQKVIDKANFNVTLKYKGISWYVTRENWDFNVYINPVK